MMSSALLFILLGQVYLFGTVSNAPQTRITLIHNLCLNIPSPVPTPTRGIRRPDYTYTPGIGAHKVHASAKNWTQAWWTCRNEGGHLAIINSFAESQLLSRLLEGIVGPYYFIGFHDFFMKSEWVTIFGQSLADAGFNEWKINEPNNKDNIEHCGSMDRDGKLNDDQCHILRYFICELPYVEP